ncbi:glucose-6-phosphatase 2-like [Varroa jacobsoni]|uniref:glucose-6-phosphatase 2-like n=1 Tax=Varroa jacobsoni TaxID=62625 RepID=UPI000BF98BDE|nr:glucose-6-phosphatase 2-like [Varroa jacobsoni]XP_022687819.1 glucose-6-phosphatase 2-like [Varroa jacobsoni]
MMEMLYRHGVVALQLLQKHGELYSKQFQQISAFCDPSYAFIIYPPLVHALCQNSGRSMLLVVVITEWTNMLLKWILMGDRPFWWVLENMKPRFEGDTIITQFPLTCETGPGSPSGHVELQAALNYAILHFLTIKVFRKAQFLSGLILWPAYLMLIIAVSLSRLYIAAHFPHQCVLGAFIGFTIAYCLVDIDTTSWRLRHYLLLTLSLYLLAVLTKYSLLLSGTDPMRTLVLARKHCANPAWIHIDTAPYFSMMRYLGFCAGLGFATSCTRYGITNRNIELPIRVVMAVATGIVGKLSENVVLPFRKADPILFYSTAFAYHVMLAYLLFAFVPAVVLKIMGGERKDGEDPRKTL